jgi:hypothetical protein
MPGPGRPDGAAPPPGQGWGTPLDADATVHRDVVRRARPAEPPPKQSKLGRRLLVGFLVLALVGGGVGAYLATQGDDDSSGRRGRDDEQTRGDETTTTAALNVPVPAGITATESQAGVELRWEGDNGQRYVVLMMSTAAQPQLLEATLGAAQLVPAAALQPNVGYCFSVAQLTSLEAAPQGREAEVFSSPECIRGASEDTVQRG